MNSFIVGGAIQAALRKLESNPGLADRTMPTSAQIEDRLTDFVLRSIYFQYNDNEMAQPWEASFRGYCWSMHGDVRRTSKSNHTLSVKNPETLCRRHFTILPLFLQKMITKTKTKRSPPVKSPQLSSNLQQFYLTSIIRALRRCLQQQGTVFKSDTTFRSHLVRPKDTVNPAKQDGVVYWGFPVSSVKFTSTKLGDLCRKESVRNTIGIFDPPVPRLLPFQSTPTRPVTIRFGTR